MTWRVRRYVSGVAPPTSIISENTSMMFICLTVRCRPRSDVLRPIEIPSGVMTGILLCCQCNFKPCSLFKKTYLLFCCCSQVQSNVQASEGWSGEYQGSLPCHVISKTQWHIACHVWFHGDAAAIKAFIKVVRQRTLSICPYSPMNLCLLEQCL